VQRKTTINVCNTGHRWQKKKSTCAAATKTKIANSLYGAFWISKHKSTCVVHFGVRTAINLCGAAQMQRTKTAIRLLCGKNDNETMWCHLAQATNKNKNNNHAVAIWQKTKTKIAINMCSAAQMKTLKNSNQCGQHRYKNTKTKQKQQ